MKSITDSVTEILCAERKKKLKLDQDYDNLFYLNLCDNCEKCIATCDGTPVFGLGVGFDNVIKCDKHFDIMKTI